MTDIWLDYNFTRIAQTLSRSLLDIDWLRAAPSSSPPLQLRKQALMFSSRKYLLKICRKLPEEVGSDWYHLDQSGIPAELLILKPVPHMPSTPLTPLPTLVLSSPPPASLLRVTRVNFVEKIKRQKVGAAFFDNLQITCILYMLYAAFVKDLLSASKSSSILAPVDLKPETKDIHKDKDKDSADCCWPEKGKRLPLNLDTQSSESLKPALFSHLRFLQNHLSFF